MSHAINPEPVVLFCPMCSSQHEDFGFWAKRPHRTHRCLFCSHEWRPFPYTTVGIALSGKERTLLIKHAIWNLMPDYSCTIPTDPRDGRFWRRREPYYSDDIRARHYLGLAQLEPTDPPGQISIFWRRFRIAEFEAGRVLANLLEVG